MKTAMLSLGLMMLAPFFTVRAEADDLKWKEQFPEEIVRHDGSKLSTAFFENKWTLVYFGFVDCAYVCPMALKTLAAVEKRLTAKSKVPVQTLFVTVDPERDTPERLAAHRKNFSETIVGATGPKLAISKFSYMLSGRAAPAEPAQHSGTIFVISPQKELALRLSRTMKQSEMVKLIDPLIEK